MSQTKVRIDGSAAELPLALADLPKHSVDQVVHIDLAPYDDDRAAPALNAPLRGGFARPAYRSGIGAAHSPDYSARMRVLLGLKPSLYRRCMRRLRATRQSVLARMPRQEWHMRANHGVRSSIITSDDGSRETSHRSRGEREIADTNAHDACCRWEWLRPAFVCIAV